MLEKKERKILANGVFDLLHPGHLYYLRKSRELGNHLTVVLSRDSLIDKDPVLEEEERLKMVEALEVVDRAFLGFEDPESHIYRTMEKVDPDVVTLGYDQDFDGEKLEKDLRDRGFDVEVVRIPEIPAKNISSTRLRKMVMKGN